MKTIQSTQHKEIVGSVNDVPYIVSFDADGIAEVEDAVADQLLSGRYGVVLLDEDGAEVDPNTLPSTPVATDTAVPDPDPVPDQTEAPQKTNSRRKSLDEGSGTE